MSWRIWISHDTRVKQKVISASSAVSKPCGVEVKLQVKIVITNPLSPSHITESTQLFGTVENSPTEFSVESPTWIRTISRGDNWREDWIRLCRWFPQHEHFSRSRPLQCFHVSFLVSRLLSGFITLLLQTLAFYYVNDVKIHTSEHLNDLGSHFLETALGPSVWIQTHINIDFTKFGASRLSFRFCDSGAALIWDNGLRTILLIQLRGSCCFYVCISRCYDKEY